MIAHAETDGVIIKNIGPIEHLALDARPGTITVMVGYNGKGKSTALDVIDALTRGEAKLESRDGTTGGTATGFGVTIKVGRGGANRRTGDLVVTSVEDKLSIADFVEPNIKDPVAADGRRLKALVALAGLTASPTMFEALCDTPEEFRSIVKPESLAATDPVDMAARVKRDFESASRLQTTKAERLFGEIKAKLSANDGLDLTAEHDRDALQRKLENALHEQSTLKERTDAAGRSALARQQAQTALDKAVAAYTGPTVADAELQVTQATDDRDDRQKMVERLEDQLRELKADLQDTNTKLSLAVSARNGAISHETAISGWRNTLETTAAAESPSQNVIDAAAKDVETARQLNETGVRVRDAIARKAEADALELARAAAVKRAESLRDTAASVLDVLGDGVKLLVPGLRLDEQLRIIVPHPIRKECFYAELSHGERWRLALDLAVSAFQRKGERGVLAIPQPAWEGLDGPNRAIVAGKVAETDLIVFTAEAERGLPDCETCNGAGGGEGIGEVCPDCGGTGVSAASDLKVEVLN